MTEIESGLFLRQINKLSTKNQKTNDESYQVTGSSSVGGLMRKSEDAQLCQVSVRTVDQWIAEKKIPSIKVGRNVRFRWPAVEAALMRYERRAIY